MSETTVTAATPNLNKALSQLQGELPKVTKGNEGKITYEGKEGREGGSYKYKYADLSDVTAAVGPLLAKYGLSFFAAPTIDPADRRLMILAWSLLHESGEEKTGEWPLGNANQKPQSLGSAITYGRRYCLGAATGIVAEDDDDGQRSQQDHGSRQSAGDVFDNAAPAPSRQDRTRPAPEAPQADGADEPDKDAQALADRAHKARIPADIEAIHKEAREAGKVAALIRNPASGGTGKLAVYLDWKRKQLTAAKPAGLDPDDPWAAKVEEIPEGDNAAAAAVLEELAGLVVSGDMDGVRASLVEQAVLVRFPDANKTLEPAA